MTDLADELALAQELAARADALTLPAFEQRRFTLDWKANHTEVTEIQPQRQRREPGDCFCVIRAAVADLLQELTMLIDVLACVLAKVFQWSRRMLREVRDCIELVVPQHGFGGATGNHRACDL